LQAFIAEAIDPHKYEREPALPVRLEVVAMDAPGITVKVADVLHRHQVNIENLDARLSPAPSSGSMVFSLKMKVTVPQGVSLAEVKNDLTRLASDINLDVVFQPVHE
jgi:glycine cleavage system regulatory protein